MVIDKIRHVCRSNDARRQLLHPYTLIVRESSGPVPQPT